jgi:hypothetical protein
MIVLRNPGDASIATRRAAGNDAARRIRLHGIAAHRLLAGNDGARSAPRCYICALPSAAELR